jgi:outer membrane immunogenic protein
MVKFAFFALLASAAATPVLAQDADPTSSPAAFNGFHVEAIGGWDRLQADHSHDDGALYGVGAGYDLRRGNLVFGVEGEASDSTQKESFAGVTERAKRDLYAGGRIGAVVGGNNLIYAKAGYTNARYALDGTGAGTFAHGNLDGVRVGAGVEHDMGHAFVKAEYRYSNYEQGVSRNQAVAGVGLRF